MDYTRFIGIDVSKATLDAALCQVDSPDRFAHRQFANTPAGFQKLGAWLKTEGLGPSGAFFCMEHTGHHTLALCCFLQEGGHAFTLLPPLHLKRSMGMARGKNDRVDAQRIARFACLHRHELRPMLLPSACLLKLKNLMAFRERLTKTGTALKQALADLRETAFLVDNDLVIRLSEEQLGLIGEQVSIIEKEMDATIREDPQMREHFRLATSVVGIGPVTAVAFLVYTQDFTAFGHGRQFACYAGVAPFEHSSGSSIRGRPRVSPLANKKMKALLGNCATSAIQHDPELRAYYQRKTADGKSRMATLNAVKAKLINRVFATVHRGTEYVVLQQYGAAS